MDANLEIVAVLDQLGGAGERKGRDQLVDELASLVANLSRIHVVLLLR